MKAGLTDRQKQRVAQGYLRIADVWERRYGEVAERRFLSDHKALSAALRQHKQASVNWDEVSIGWQQVFEEAGDKWRSAFVPLMQGTIEDQTAHYGAAFGMAFDVRNLYAEQWFDEYVMDFASQVVGESERELAELLKGAQREGWSIRDMQDGLDDLFDGWVTGKPPSRVAEWVTERRPPWRRELIARTETIRSSNAGIDKLFGQWGISHKEWLTTQDDRTCVWCKEMHGKIIPTGGTFFEQGSSLSVQIGDKMRAMTFSYGKIDFPPLHPACRCCLIPLHQGWEALGVEPLGRMPGRGPGRRQFQGRAPKGEDVTSDLVNKWLTEGMPSATDWQNVPSDIRGQAKHELVTALSERSGVSYEKVNQMIAQWADTSNDDDMRSLAMQKVASELFDIPLSDFTKSKIAKLEAELEALRSAHVSRFRPFRPPNNLTELFMTEEQRDIIEAMYGYTQERLVTSGFAPGSTIRLRRGVRLPSEVVEGWKAGDVVTVTGNTLESWSVGSDIAETFASGVYGGAPDTIGIVLEMDIPVEMIVGSARTGFGCLTEGEFVVLGGLESEAQIVSVMG